jgi:hypothetical protein
MYRKLCSKWIDNIGTCGTESMRTGKISTTLRKEVSRGKNICNFGRRNMQRDRISATLGEEVCRETEYLQLWANKYAERQNDCNFGRSMPADKMTVPYQRVCEFTQYNVWKVSNLRMCKYRKAIF